MSAINPDAQRALTEKRGKELDRWIMIKCVRLMSGIEPFSPTLSDLPTEIIHQVVEKLEPVEILRARKVCRSLRTVVDKFGLRFDCIDLYLRKDEVEIWFDDTIIRYTTAKNGSSCVIHNGQKKIIDGENFVERAAKDFKIVAKHAWKIAIWNYSEDRCDIVTTILSWFDVKELKTIELGSMESLDRFERITQLEHWKNAEAVEIYGSKIASTMIVHFFRFKYFDIHKLDEFPAQAAIQMRDDLLRRSTFQSCGICFEKSMSNPIEIAKVFKPDYAGGNEFKIEFSNGNDKFDISLQEDYNCFLLNMKRSLSV